MSDHELMWASLEAAAARCDDLVPLVYERLFAAYPHVVDIFAVGPGEKPNPAMGGMVNELLTLIADGIDEGLLDPTIMATLINHIGWGIDLSQYQALLDALVDSVRVSCAETWSAEMAMVWERRTALIMESLRKNQALIDGQRGVVINATPAST